MEPAFQLSVRLEAFIGLNEQHDFESSQDCAQDAQSVLLRDPLTCEDEQVDCIQYTENPGRQCCGHP